MNKIYFKLVGFAIGLTMIISIFSAASVILQLNNNGIIAFQIGAFLLTGLLLFAFMKRKDSSMQQFGFKKQKINKGIYSFIALVVSIQPLILGINFSLSIPTVALLIVQMILVGFVEEGLFRGVFFYFLKEKKPIVFISFSSIIFGILHIASGLNPETTSLLVCLQIINALLLGVVFALLYCATQSIYLVMGFHALFNTFASISFAGSLQQNILAVTLLTVCYLIFIVYYLRQLVPEKKTLTKF